MTKFNELKYGDLIVIAYQNMFEFAIFRKMSGRSLQFWNIRWQLKQFQNDNYPSYINSFDGRRVVKINESVLDVDRLELYKPFKEILKERGICQ